LGSQAPAEPSGRLIDRSSTVKYNTQGYEGAMDSL